ncbi:acetamidase/formamidase family protein [Salipaludibacillus sp. CUR1]|uniref:acetamidase/formamidase family protein n=1 Tax=Salipaludibacillus sp. CUR1 TaxID=2820003 RepID=UPI001E39FF0B|nr:acetamidase/formamidase family protein [Salipaludibacillus sp. CUR1]MCE7791627.1 acetamidase/formamidase family protein [Salipaludibacillus sp. CUR1]
MKGKESILVNQFVNGILDPKEDMLGPVQDGGHIIANTAPGCWGPMITPCLRGGHEVTKPVFVEGAEPGDAIAVRIKSIRVTSIATASGNDAPVEGRFLGDPFVAVTCPECSTMYPETVIKGTGQEAIRCAECGADVTPFRFTHAYTMTFDDSKEIGMTLNKAGAEKIAGNGHKYMATPEHSVQNPIVTFAPHDMPGTLARLRPFLGQLGTTPSRPFPDSHNAGDFGSFLVDAPHEYALTEEQLEDRTDGHMDINRAREGAVVICPVKVPGGGVYLGDMHAMQGDGEIAGHTTDVSGIVTLQVNVIKGLNIEGPLILPVHEDLPYLAKPFTKEEREKAERLAKDWHMEQQLEKSLPLSFVGTGPTLNEAVTNGMERAAKLLEVSVPEVMNRSTITGAIEIGRNPGVVTVTFLVPVEELEKIKLDRIAIEQYGEVE